MRMFRFVVLFVQVLASLPTPGEMQGNGDLRLAGELLYRNLTKGIGRLEIFLDGRWGTVCGPISDQFDADTACRQLGYDFSVIYGSIQDLQITEANESTPILLDDLDCLDYDKPQHILRCSYSTTVSEFCYHAYDAAIQCGGHVNIFYDTKVRLTSGTWPSTGVLEVYIEDKGKWGTICSSNFNKGAADSACRQLGYTNAMSYSGVNNPPGSTVWISSATCSSSKPCLNNCFHYPTSPVSRCSGDGTVVSLNCTFDISQADSSTPGSESQCTYVPGVPDLTRFYWIGAGIGAIVVIVFVIVFIVVAVVIVFKLKSRQIHYVQVDS